MPKLAQIEALRDDIVRMFTEFEQQRAQKLNQFKIFAFTDWRTLTKIDVKGLIDGLNANVEQAEKYVSCIQRKLEYKVKSLLEFFDKQFNSFQTFCNNQELM